jgi:Flp pilus assembly protein TadD
MALDVQAPGAKKTRGGIMKGARFGLTILCMAVMLGCTTSRKSTSVDSFEKARQSYEDGIALSREGRFEEALSAFKRAVRHQPQYGNAYYNMGIVYHELDRPEDAVKAYRKAIEINPGDAAAHVNLGNLYLRRAELTAAVMELETAVRIDPTYGLAHHNLALAYYLARMYHRAWDHILELERLGISPDAGLKDAVAAALNPDDGGLTEPK